MALVKWRPQRELVPFGGLKEEVDRLFDDFFHTWPSVTPFSHVEKIETGFMPHVNLKDEKNNFLMEADLPGINKDDLKLNISETTVTLEGQRQHKWESKKEDEGYYMMESSFGAFRRVIPLPEPINADKVEAKLKDGLLTLRLPKTKPRKEKAIEIKVE